MMAPPADPFPGLSGRRLALLAGVLPQTRDSWVQRGLLDRKDTYGQSDLIELVVLSALLDRLPKGDAPVAWAQIRPTLLRRIALGAAVVWDAERRSAVLAQSESEIVKATVHGRPVQALPIGPQVAEARAALRNEVGYWRRKEAQRLSSKNPRGSQNDSH